MTNVKEVWTYRAPTDALVQNSIKDILLSDPSLGEVLPVIKNICERRANVGILNSLGYVGIASSHNREHYVPAAERIIKAINQKEEILVYGDFDVDGMTATACLYKVLKACGANISYYIPSRLTGHGLHADEIKNSTCKLVVTVDTGITAIDEVAVIKAQDKEVIITDHHLPDMLGVPETTIINPKVYTGEDDPEFMAPGIYVASKLALLVARYFIKDGAKWIEQHKYCAQLTTLGIVSDVIPLNQLMRQQAAYGIICLCESTHDGLNALLTLCGHKDFQSITTRFLSYVCIPKMNAAGRLGHCEDCLRVLLLDKDESLHKSDSLLAANRLKSLNEERKLIEHAVFDQALEQIEATHALESNPHSIIVYQNGWHKGVVGIVASKLTELYRVPALVLTSDRPDGDITGSGRTVEGVDLYKSLEYCFEKGSIKQFGGHTRAAGLVTDMHHLTELRQQFEFYVGTQLKVVQHQVIIDSDVTFQELYDVRLTMFLESMEPTGSGNPSVVLKLPPAIVYSVRKRGEVTSLVLIDEKGHTLMVSKYQAPESWDELLDRNVEVLVTPVFSAFSVSTTIDWDVVSLRETDASTEA